MSKPEQPEWFKEYVRGYSNADNYSVYLEGTKYAIMKCPGGSYWSGMYGMKYSPVSYQLIKKGVNFWQDHTRGKDLWTGRLTKEAKELLKKALEEKENGKADKTTPKVD